MPIALVVSLAFNSADDHVETALCRLQSTREPARAGSPDAGRDVYGLCGFEGGLRVDEVVSASFGASHLHLAAWLLKN